MAQVSRRAAAPLLCAHARCETLARTDILRDIQKPIPYFFPFVETVERAIKARASASYTARVTIDGIDRQKAAELTNALRDRGITLEMVRGKRDESEPLIRLADMWAGCIRAAQLDGEPEKEMLDRALTAGQVVNLKP